MTHHPDQATGPGWDIFVAGPGSDVYVQALRPSRTTLRAAPGAATVWHSRTRVRFTPPPLASRRPALASSTCSPGRLVLFRGEVFAACDQGAERGRRFLRAAPCSVRMSCVGGSDQPRDLAGSDTQAAATSQVHAE